jgi:uncharacterized membrane protein
MVPFDKELSNRDSSDFKELVRKMQDLSARLQQLEQRVDALAQISPSTYSSDNNPVAVPQVDQHPQLESQIGSQWLNRVGVIALLFGVAYLLRYAFVREWVSAASWIWLGVCGGIAVIIASEWFSWRGYRVLSISLKATGIGVSYLCLWAGLELYQLLSGPQSFSGILMLTALAAALALRESAEVLAILAVLAGFLTPLLVSIPSREIPLLSYIALLDCASATIAVKRRWSRLVAVSFAATSLLCVIWYFQHYSPLELLTTTLAATVFFAIFCIAGAWVQRRFSGGAPSLLTFVELLNPVFYFAAVYLLVNPTLHHAPAIPALTLSALYLGFAWRWEGSFRVGAKIRVVVYGGLGAAFIAITIAILLHAEWVSLGWVVEAAVLMSIGLCTRFWWLRWNALLLLCTAIVKAFALDVWQLSLAYRTLSFIGLGLLLLVISFAYQRYGPSMITSSQKPATSRHS